jgi:hypothetical protein
MDNRFEQDLNSPSLFRKGGLLLPGPDRVHIQVGKNPDGCWYIDLRGPTGPTGNIRSVMTPLQMFNLCTQTLGHMGYAVELKPPAADSYELQLAAADKP